MVSSPPPPPDFSAIGSADAEPPEDSIASKEKDQFFPNEPTLNSQAHRLMRWLAFFGFGAISCAYLIALLCVLIDLGSAEQLAGIIGAAKDWHFLLLVGLGMVVFAAVPLSLTLGLFRMISDKNDEEDKKNSFTTPHVEALKVCAEILKGAR